jgi:hypothetical protein
METLFCKKCNSEQEYYDVPNPPHISAYCGSCDSFIKYVPKNGTKINTDIMIHFGKYKGTKIKDCIDKNYIAWVIGNVELKPYQKAVFETRLKELQNG